jgi:O-methyltransferase
MRRMSDASTVRDPAALYLDLIKRALSYTLWEEPGIPIETFNYSRPPLRRAAFSALSWLFARLDMQLLRNVHYTRDQRAKGAVMPMHAHTMIGLERLDNLQFCIEDALANGVPGDLIETGVWRGGACILMRAVLAAHGVTDRRVFVADSFAGLPPPDTSAYPKDEGDRHHEQRFLDVSRQQVEENFRLYGLLDSQVVFLEGWFKDTLPKVPTDALCVMRLDGDMYQSTMEALTNLYPRLSPGGYCIIDDYDIPRCREAVTDYRADQRIASPIRAIDASGVFWQKRD